VLFASIVTVVGEGKPVNGIIVKELPSPSVAVTVPLGNIVYETSTDLLTGTPAKNVELVFSFMVTLFD
jgi:hypothetical protein